jgi:hypothetical protein
MVAFAQSIHYSYDAAGNRDHRWLAQPIAPPQNSSNHNNASAIIEDINKMALTKTNEIINEGSIKVFPNPLQHKFNIEFNANSSPEGKHLEIYDGNAKLFYRLSTLTNLTSIDMKQAKSGTYYLLIIDKDGKSLYWKLIKD